MYKVTQLEDFSNDLFLDIFDYLHALDVFMAFSSLNSRISSILSLTRLHVVVSKRHCRHQIEILSSYLIHQAHQVISISLQDQLRDFSSVICYFFNQHTFENLRSCIFHSICPSSELHNVIQKLESLNKLVSFQIFQSNDTSLSDAIKQDLSKTILTHRSPELRSVDLLFRYNYPKLISNIAVNSILTSLRMMFHGSMFACSIYSILPILRHYRALRILYIFISNDDNLNTRQAIIPILPATCETNPPILPSIKTFDLSIKTLCDFRSLSFILRCMPNLRRFIVTIIFSSSMSPLWKDIFKGDIWEQLLTNNTSHLDIFDIFLHIKDLNTILDRNIIINSFDYFTRKYDDWYVAIHQSRRKLNNQKQQISLRGFRRSKKVRYWHFSGTRMVLDTLNMHSNTITDAQHHLFYSHCIDLHINIPVNMRISDTLSSGQLFKNIDYLIVEMDSSMLSFWEDILDLFHIRCNVAEIDQKERADKLASLVDLTGITKLEFQPKDDISQLHFIKEVLLASSQVIQLKIGNALIFSSILYDYSFLTPVFDRLQSLYLLSEHVYFPLKYASKIIERFPSLVHLELEVYSVDICISLLNILLDGLSKLIHLKIHFYKNTLMGDGTCLINHIIERRRQAFPNHTCHQDEISVKIDEQIMNIYLSNCSICADMKYFV